MRCRMWGSRIATATSIRVNLLVRGMCSLIPDLPGISENIRVISIVDRYLEHDRVYIFENGGEKKVFLSSAAAEERNTFFSPPFSKI